MRHPPRSSPPRALGMEGPEAPFHRRGSSIPASPASSPRLEFRGSQENRKLCPGCDSQSALSLLRDLRRTDLHSLLLAEFFEESSGSAPCLHPTTPNRPFGERRQ